MKFPVFHSTTVHLLLALLLFAVLIASGAVLIVDYAECVTFGKDQCDARDAQRYGIAGIALGAIGIILCLVMFFAKRHWVGEAFYVAMTFLAAMLLVVAGALGTNLHALCNSFGTFAQTGSDFGFQIATILIGAGAIGYFIYVAYMFSKNPNRYHMMAQDLDELAARLQSIGVKPRNA